MNEIVEHALSRPSYHVPTEAELVRAWQDLYATGVSPETITPVRGVRGVVAKRPGVGPKILSVDLCEVLRRTHEMCASVQGYDASYIGNTVWTYGGYGVSSAEAEGIARIVINRGLVPPVAAIAEIRHILQQAHRDTLVVANTATALGTEVATIQFLKTYLPDCFDGILFPRNFEGTAQLTKGHALQYLIETLGVPFEHAAVAHIDDAPYHNEAVLDVMERRGVARVKATMPLFESGKNAIRREPVPVPTGVDTVNAVVDAFTRSVEFLSHHNAVEPIPATR